MQTTTSQKDAADIIRRLGFYRANYEAGVHSTSLVYRTVVGVLSGLFPQALALETGLEFFLRSVLEVPAGILADRVGRIRCALAGLSFINLAIALMYVAILVREHRSLCVGLVVACGICFGLGSPLLSGSVEGFYQDALERATDGSEAVEFLKKRSFALSEKHGWLLPTIVLVLSFAVFMICQRTIGGHHALLMNIAIWMSLMIRLIRDSRALGFAKVVKQPTMGHTTGAIADILKRKTFWWPCSLQILVYFGRTVGIGYMIVSLGRALMATYGDNYWWLLLSFMAGQLTLGWYLKAYFLPRMISTLPEHRILVRLGLFFFTANALMWWGMDGFTVVTWIPTIFLYTAAFQFFIGGVGAISTNALLAHVPREFFTTALSLQNMPGYIAGALYSFYLVRWADGAPTLGAAFRTLAALSLFLAVYSALHSLKKKGGGRAPHPPQHC